MRSQPEKGNASEVAATEALNVKPQVLTQGINMSNCTEVTTQRAITVPFHGADLYVAEHNGQPYTPMKAIVEGMGLAWQPQHRKLAANKARWGITELVIPSAGGSQAMTCAPLRKLPGWMSNIEVGEIKSNDVRARVIQYQNECDDVLWKYWNDGVAENPRARPYNPAIDYDRISPAQAQDLKEIVDAIVKARIQGFGETWARLHRKFKVNSYLELPATLHLEARGYLLAKLPTPQAGNVLDAVHDQESVQSIVSRLVRQIETANGAPALVFLPLVQAVQRKLGNRALPQLPRLDLYMQPPASGQYQFNRSNPYPRNGRTIEVAKSIAADIRNWSDNLPAGPARTDLHDAAQMLYDLLVSGWTEVDEALGQLHSAMHFLNRWQGRGGGIGNVR